MPASVSAEDVLAVDPAVEGDVLRADLRLGDQVERIHYRLGGIEPARATDALAVALLPIAMSRRWALELPGGLSPRLRDGLDSAQAILDGWWRDWARIELTAGGPAAASPPPGRGRACFFTGGVDSFYSVLTELDRLDAVIFVHGFDVPLHDAAWRERVARSLREAARELDLELVEVETDVKDLTWPACKWGFHAHGAALASVAHLLSGRFDEVLIPASHTYRDLFPWGSHALLDPLWSSDAVAIVHHGARARTRKVATLAQSQTALAHLRCCYDETGVGEINCGHCEKCVRTMASLRIVGALDRCATLPSELPLAEVRRLPVPSRGWETLIDDLVVEAEAAGDRELARALRTALRVGPLRTRAAKARKALRSSATRRLRRGRRRLRKARRRARRRMPGFSTPSRDRSNRAGYGVRPAVLPDDREAMLAVLEPEGLDRIPSPEMDDFDVGEWYVAENDGAIVGVAGFRISGNGQSVTGKNLLLAVLEEHRGRGIGRALVDHRLRLMRAAGVTTVVTNTDRPDLIAWLVRDYGYREVGELRKLHSFGRPEVDRWTTLEAPMSVAAAGISSKRAT